MLVGWLWLRPARLVADWNGWRQADTQTIALNLAKPDGRLLYPQIAWGGEGPGYVEAELQLYPALFAPILRRVGSEEWPGQLVSLVLFAGAGLVLGALLVERFGPLPALLGVLAFLSTRAALHLATAVQPEALLVFLFVVAWGAFLRFEATERMSWLLGFGLAGAAAMLVKPSAAQIGIASFVLLALRSRHLLRQPRIYVVWLSMLCVLIGYLAFAREIFLTYGNTFGILSGGDSKLPRLEHLVRPGLYVEAARVAVSWGLGLAGALCALGLALRKRVPVEALALAPGAAAWSVLTLRYSSEEAYGSHYSVLAGVIGAYCVAQVAELLRTRPRARLTIAALALLVAVQGAAATQVRLRHLEPDRGASCVIALARATEGRIPASGLIVVRAATFAYDPYWKTPNNYQDPRPFYLAGGRGFVIGSDQDDPAAMARFVARGARVYLEPESRYRTPAIDRWLESHARPLGISECGRALALFAPPDTPASHVP
jgi:uncharacterized membrane protein YeaQ/YmgE (transglycosylase-associated protein family)